MPKQVVSAEHAINWYVGNYLMSPDNALRDDESLLDEGFKQVEKLRQELAGKRITHKQLLGLVKERGIHAKYYRYQKYEPPYCEACEKLGVPRRWRQ